MLSQIVAITAADVVRSFAKARELASNAPLFVTNHGRQTHVLLGVGLFESLLRQAKQPSPSTDSGFDDEVFDLADWSEDGFILCDAAFNIKFCNRVAHSICRRHSGSLTDRPFLEALPEASGTLLEAHLRRTMIASEPGMADIPSPFAENSWLRIHTFPLGKRSVLTFRDISEDFRRQHLADMKETLLKTIQAHGEIGVVRVSVRGHIEQTDQQFCEMLGLNKERLQEAQLVDLIARPDRAAFREALNGCLQHGKSTATFTRFLSNGDHDVPAKVAIGQLHGTYGVEGAILIITRYDPAGS